MAVFVVRCVRVPVVVVLVVPRDDVFDVRLCDIALGAVAMSIAAAAMHIRAFRVFIAFVFCGQPAVGPDCPVSLPSVTIIVLNLRGDYFFSSAADFLRLSKTHPAAAASSATTTPDDAQATACPTANDCGSNRNSTVWSPAGTSTARRM